jgi:hypothetical protein
VIQKIEKLGFFGQRVVFDEGWGKVDAGVFKRRN